MNLEKKNRSLNEKSSNKFEFRHQIETSTNLVGNDEKL